VADLREGGSRSPKTKVSSTDNRDAHVCTHETTDNRIWPLPFVGESQGESFEELSCFTPDQPISGDDKRSEVLALFETGLQLLILLFALLSGQDLVGVSGPIRLGVRISHTDVNNDIRPTGPEASNEEIHSTHTHHVSN
jgi:hypothetical protein